MVGEVALERPSPRQPNPLAAVSTLLPVSLLWERYSLDPFTGTFHQKTSDRPLKGKIAKTSKNYSRKELSLGWNGKKSTVIYSRAIHAWMTGHWSAELIDHKDRNPFNNQPWNLRERTVRQNRQNSETFKGGAYFQKGRWYARIWIDGRFKRLGGHATQAGAQAAYAAALSELVS